MSTYLITIIVATLGSVAYHVLQRTISPNTHPLVSLLATYTTALVLTLVAIPFVSDLSFGTELRKLGWASFALGAAIIALELGYLLAYRAGWNLSAAALYSNTAVAIVLVPIGVLAFQDGIDARRLAGLGLALAGLVLIGHKP